MLGGIFSILNYSLMIHIVIGFLNGQQPPDGHLGAIRVDKQLEGKPALQWACNVNGNGNGNM